MTYKQLTRHDKKFNNNILKYSYWYELGIEHTEIISKLKYLKDRKFVKFLEFNLEDEFWINFNPNNLEKIISDTVYSILTFKYKNLSEIFNLPNGSSHRNVEWWLSRGWSLSESREKVKEKQITFSLKICIEKYGELKGVEVFNTRQEKWLLSLSNRSKQEKDETRSKQGVSLEKFIMRNGALGEKKYQDYCFSLSKAGMSDEKYNNKIRKQINTKIDLGLIRTIEDMKDFDYYSNLVRKLTNKQNWNNLKNSDKRGMCGLKGTYNLDHCISIADGFDNNIPIHIIADIENLQMLTWLENTTKGRKSYSTLS